MLLDGRSSPASMSDGNVSKKRMNRSFTNVDWNDKGAESVEVRSIPFSRRGKGFAQ